MSDSEDLSDIVTSLFNGSGGNKADSVGESYGRPEVNSRVDEFF